MPEKEPTISDQILDLLLDALQERLQARQDESPFPRPKMEPGVEPELSVVKNEPIAQMTAVAPREEKLEGQKLGPRLSDEPEFEPQPLILEPVTAITPAGLGLGLGLGPEFDLEPPIPEPVPRINLERTLGRLFFGLIILVVLINIPFNRYGTNLARAMPDSASLVIRDGLVLKGSGEEIYVLENNQRRWITSLDAFEWYGYRWEQVREVDDAFLNEFAEGRPIHLLLKCSASPHIYALEDGQKRWIKDIPTFEARQYLWEDIKFVNCGYLRNLPDGLPIPEDAGPPPQP
jgi:hypothetical protein